MKRTLTITAMLLCFAVGSLSGGNLTAHFGQRTADTPAPPPFRPPTSSVAASPVVAGQVPCLHQYVTGLGMCTDNKVLQETWSFPLTDFVGNAIPKGCPIGLQMTRNANVPVGQPPFTMMQYIYSNYPGSGMIGGAAYFGPALPISDAYWLQLKAGLNAQTP